MRILLNQYLLRSPASDRDPPAISTSRGELDIDPAPTTQSQILFPQQPNHSRRWPIAPLACGPQQCTCAPSSRSPSPSNAPCIPQLFSDYQAATNAPPLQPPAECCNASETICRA